MNTKAFFVRISGGALALAGLAASGQQDIDDFGLGEGGDAAVQLEVWEPIIARFYLQPESGASSVRGPDNPVELTKADGRMLIGEWESWRELKTLIGVHSLKTRLPGGFYDADCVYAKDEPVLSGWRRKVSPDTGAILFEVRRSAKTGGADDGVLVERAEPRMTLFLDIDILTNTGPDDRAERIRKGEFRIVELSITAHKVSDDVNAFRHAILAEDQWGTVPKDALTAFTVRELKPGETPGWEDVSQTGIVLDSMMGPRSGLWEFRAKAVVEAKFGPNDPAVRRPVEGVLRMGFKPSGFVPQVIYEERSGWRPAR